MCIRDRAARVHEGLRELGHPRRVLGCLGQPDEDLVLAERCLLYTSDAADDLLCVDLRGRRITKKKKKKETTFTRPRFTFRPTNDSFLVIYFYHILHPR